MSEIENVQKILSENYSKCNCKIDDNVKIVKLKKTIKVVEKDFTMCAQGEDKTFSVNTSMKTRMSRFIKSEYFTLKSISMYKNILVEINGEIDFKGISIRSKKPDENRVSNLPNVSKIQVTNSQQ